MISPKVGFIVFGVHKDGLKDPMGKPFIDAGLVQKARAALKKEGVTLVEHKVVIASKQEARACLSAFKKMDDLDAIVLFSGTWVWAAHLIGALRDFAACGKPITLWTHPGSQGWRPVGGLVMHAAMKEIGIRHCFVYAEAESRPDIARIVAWCKAGALRNRLNMSTCGVFGGRGMGQTCGVADPAQWMRMFGIDIDTRDTTDLIDTARAVSKSELEKARARIQPLFSVRIPADETAERSIRLYLAIKKILTREH